MQAQIGLMLCNFLTTPAAKQFHKSAPQTHNAEQNSDSSTALGPIYDSIRQIADIFVHIANMTETMHITEKHLPSIDFYLCIIFIIRLQSEVYVNCFKNLIFILTLLNYSDKLTNGEKLHILCNKITLIW